MEMEFKTFLIIVMPFLLLVSIIITYIMYHDDLKTEEEEIITKIDKYFIKIWHYLKK